jgi:hypothetical protein
LNSAENSIHPAADPQIMSNDEVWKAGVRNKITQGMDSIRAGRTIPAQKVKTEMAAFKKKWKKNRSLQ